MKRMSFSMTKEQVKNQTKTVTRRNGWLKAKPGDIIQPIEKGMGLKKGEKQVKIGPPIRILHVDREPINHIRYWPADLIKEGFDNMSVSDFMVMYCKANKCKPSDYCTRIEYEYLNNYSPGLFDHQNDANG